MPGYRKLGRTSSQRKALLRGQVTSLIINGQVKTTEAKAKEVRKLAEKAITLAVKEYTNFTTKKVTVSSAKLDGKGRKILMTATSKNDRVYDVVEREKITKEVEVDLPSRLAARRQLLTMLEDTYNSDGERIKTVNYLFSNVAPRYAGKDGGYTRITKLGPRRGDAAPMVMLELV